MNSDRYQSQSILSSKLFLSDLLVIIILLLAALAINADLVLNGIKFISDLPLHITWLQHFSKQLTEGIWYPRWLAGTNYGYGNPSFVFYPPLVYYIGSFLKFIGLNIQQTITYLFILASFGSGISFYSYARNTWGKIAACLGSLFYLTLPYLVLNSHVRGSLAETWALVWLPLGVLLTEKAIRQPKWRLALAFLVAIISLTHVPSLLLYTIVWCLYSFCFLLRGYTWKAVVLTIGSALLGLGIASFYLLPAILEKSWVGVDTMRSVSGGFQANLIGTPVNWVSKFMLNNIQPIFLQGFLEIICLTIIVFLCYRQDRQKIKIISYWLLFLLSISLMMTYPSVRIWQASKTLQMVQFPWRLMGLFSFGVSVMFTLAVRGIIRTSYPKKIVLWLVILVIIITNVNHSYKLTKQLPGFNDQNAIASYIANKKPKYVKGVLKNIKILNIAFYDPYSNGLEDAIEYRPLTPNRKLAPLFEPGHPPISVLNGKALIQLNKWGSYERLFNLSVKETSVIAIRSYYYPAWHLYINQKPHPIIVSSNGTITMKLDPGSYQVELRYLWTNSFKLGIILSMISIIVIGLYFWKIPNPSV
ncbi:MAG: YfhO family protein [Moorea sp. SIO2B7]|nr:YfhO family protein [Moorena sp. SIO2B7]